MGSTLTTPITEKESTDDSNNSLTCGASCMQGWRDTHEDSFSCILDFDTNTSYFGVYDGHGGHEVALYCSENLPQFLKQTEAYQKGNMKKALEDAFLEFDGSLVTPEVIERLKELARIKRAKGDDSEDDWDRERKKEKSANEEEEKSVCEEKISHSEKERSVGEKENSNSEGDKSNSEGKKSYSKEENSDSVEKKSDSEKELDVNNPKECSDEDEVGDKDVAKEDVRMENSGDESHEESEKENFKKESASTSPSNKSSSDGIDNIVSSSSSTKNEAHIPTTQKSEQPKNKNKKGSDKLYVVQSGSTGVVALLCENELYVANVGDSRCIVCRNGKAIEMSFDHKPRNEPERERIVKAGGRVNTDENRLCNDLNLSRAFGDHRYKQNKDLSNREQIVIALPDIRTLTINPKEDEFLLLACDGIWDCMSCEEVIDFIRPLIQDGKKKLSQICEELFDECLKKKGQDNMTAILVQFKSHILKRSAEKSGCNKKLKTEEIEEKEEENRETDAV